MRDAVLDGPLARAVTTPELASPIDNIRNTQRIAYVIHHGAIVDREKLIASTFPTAVN